MTSLRARTFGKPWNVNVQPAQKRSAGHHLFAHHLASNGIHHRAMFQPRAPQKTNAAIPSKSNATSSIAKKAVEPVKKREGEIEVLLPAHDFSKKKKPTRSFFVNLQVEVAVPKPRHGVIIGAAGATIAKLSKESNAHIFVPRSTYASTSIKYQNMVSVMLQIHFLKHFFQDHRAACRN